MDRLGVSAPQRPETRPPQGSLPAREGFREQAGSPLGPRLARASLTQLGTPPTRKAPAIVPRPAITQGFAMTSSVGLVYIVDNRLVYASLTVSLSDTRPRGLAVKAWS
jgi:hypothetical protein